MLRYVIGLVAILAVFSSCETKFNLTGDYEERALIYGLLDPRDNPSAGGDGHLFRIQKAFLGEESAFVMAQSPDSSYFRYESLLVELVELNGNNETNRWQLDTVIISDKDTGDPNDDVIDFFGPEQRLYRADANILASRSYRIELHNVPRLCAENVSISFSGSNQITAGSNVEDVIKPGYYVSGPSLDGTFVVESVSGNVITLDRNPAATGTANLTFCEPPIADSQIEIVNSGTFRFDNPTENSPLAQRMILVSQTGGDYINYNFKFRQAERVGLYEIWFRFHYREVRNGIETPKTIEWLVRTVEVTSDLQGVTVLQNPVAAQEIFSRIGSEIPEEEGVIRKIGQADGDANDEHPNDGHTQDLDIIVRMAGQELFEYLDINDPTNGGVLQDKPVYTNINNGLGVFSCRTSDEYLNRLYLSNESYDQLVGGEFTSGRGFVVDPD